MKILVKKIRTGTRTYTTYPYGGEDYQTLASRLFAEFRTQGEFYEKVLGVSQEWARWAGWHPENGIFDTRDPGWKKMIEDEGKINADTTQEEVDIKTLLFREG